MGRYPSSKFTAVTLVLGTAMLGASISLAQTPVTTPSGDTSWVQIATFITMLAGGASALLTAGILVGRLLQKLDNLNNTMKEGLQRNDDDHKTLKECCQRHEKVLVDHEKRVAKVEAHLDLC